MKSKLYINNGDKEWRLPGGDLHREDGPAVEWNNGRKEWWINGKRHRVGGPAYIMDRYKVWYIDGVKCEKKDYNKKLRLYKLKHIL